MTKIIFVHLLNDHSGSPKVLSQVINLCETEGREVVLFTGGRNEGFLSDVTHQHKFYFYKRNEIKLITLFTFILSQIDIFFKLLKYRNEDVIIYVNTMLPFGAALSGKLMKKPVFYHIHETSISPKYLKYFLRFITFKTASKIIFVSNYLKNSESFKNVNQKTIYNVLPTELSKKGLDSKYSPKDLNGYFNVLMICSLKAYKGVEEFLEIAKLCSTNNNITFTLLLNVKQHEIDAHFSNIILPINISIKTTQKAIHQLYSEANLVLNLSRIDQWVETFGLTILEALTFGIPVIAPPIGGPSEIVTDGKEGYLISSNETDIISKKIIQLSQDEQKCMELSENARKRSLYFNEKTFKSEILKLFNA